MNQFNVHPPLSNIQAELLKVFSAEVPEKYLDELKEIIARFLIDKASDNADSAWDEKGYTDERLQQILNRD